PSSTRVTVAPGTTASLLSSTVPAMPPVMLTCARAAVAHKSTATDIATPKHRFMFIAPLSQRRAPASIGTREAANVGMTRYGNATAATERGAMLFATRRVAGGRRLVSAALMAP